MYKLTSLLLLFIPLMSHTQEEVGDEEIVLICDRLPTPMVYIDVSKKFQSEIVRELHRDEEERVEYCNEENLNSWVCSHFSLPRIFIGLDGNGKEMGYGLICNPESKLNNQKYYSRGYLHEELCFQFSWEDGEFLAYYE